MKKTSEAHSVVIGNSIEKLHNVAVIVFIVFVFNTTVKKI